MTAITVMIFGVTLTALPKGCGGRWALHRQTYLPHTSWGRGGGEGEDGGGGGIQTLGVQGPGRLCAQTAARLRAEVYSHGGRWRRKREKLAACAQGHLTKSRALGSPVLSLGLPPPGRRCGSAGLRGCGAAGWGRGGPSQ